MVKEKIKLFGKKIFFLTCFGGTIFYILYGTQHLIWYQDGGIPLHFVQRLLGGEKLYRHLFTIWMPGSFYLLQTWFHLTSANLNSLKIIISLLFFLLTANIFLLTYQLSRSLTLAALAPLLFLFPTVAPIYNHNWWGILFLLFALNYNLKKPLFSPRKYFINGLLTALCFFFLLASGIISGLAFFLFLLVSPLKKREKLVCFFSLAAGITIPILFLLIFFAREGILYFWFKETLLFPLQNYHHGNMEQFPSQIWWTTSLFYLLFWFSRWKRKFLSFSLHSRIFLTALMGSLTHLWSLTSPTSGHAALSYAFTAPLALLYSRQTWSFLFAPPSFSAPSWRSLLQGQFIRLSLQRSLIFLLLTTFYFKIGYNFIAKVAYWEKENYLLTTPQGKIWATAQQKAILEFLKDEKNNLQSKAIFIFPWSPELYYLFQLKNPTPYSHLGPEFYFHPPTIQRIIKNLEAQKVCFVLALPQQSPILYQEKNALFNYLEKNYHPRHIFSPAEKSRPLNEQNILWQRQDCEN